MSAAVPRSAGKAESAPRPEAPLGVKLLAVVASALLFVPLLTLVSLAFVKRTPEGGFLFTLEWFTAVFQDARILAALGTSLWIGLWSALLSAAIGTAAAIALVRADFPGKKAFEVLTHVPLVMPEIVMGISLLAWFVFLKLTLGQFSVILAHVCFSLSYVILTVKARLLGIDPQLEEAAQDLGASPWIGFWRVTFPLLLPGVLSGAVMAFTLSFDDFLITFFTAGVGVETLPLRIYAMIKFGVSPEINALSTLLLAVTIIGVLIAFRPFGALKKSG